eukprot:NODE_47_length_32105_cov_1.240892.p13 type:complete len:268 gc:universal NODE_47_length_32105_cov_1.240892:17707-18510(+)
MLQKMKFEFKPQNNCCDSLYEITCSNQNVTDLILYDNAGPLSTVDGYAFSILDIPSSLQTITIVNHFIQTAQIPNIPAHVKYIQFTNANIGGKLPTLLEGLETLKVTNANLNQTIPPLPSTLKVLKLIDCNLYGPIPELPPNLQELQVQGNNLTGPLPIFPASLKIVILGDGAREGNVFNDRLILQNPTTLILGNTSIYDVQISNTTSLTYCDLSFSPLQNNINIANFTMCSKYYLTNWPLNLLQNTVTENSKSSNFFLSSRDSCIL